MPRKASNGSGAASGGKKGGGRASKPSTQNEMAEPRQTSNSAEVRQILADAAREIENAEAQMQPLKERVSDIKKAVKEKTGIAWSHWSSIYKLKQLQDNDGTGAREALIHMALAAEALGLLKPGESSDMFSISPGTDPNPEAKPAPSEESNIHPLHQ